MADLRPRGASLSGGPAGGDPATAPPLLPEPADHDSLSLPLRVSAHTHTHTHTHTHAHAHTHTHRPCSDISSDCTAGTESGSLCAQPWPASVVENNPRVCLCKCS